MPKVAQNNIFAFADSAELLIVFGHRGFNQMDVAWSEFGKRFPSVAAMGEVFTSFDSYPHEYAVGRFIVTVAEERNHGMSDDQLHRILDNYFQWAKENGLRHIATNGIMDVDHSEDSATNFNSDARRAKLIIDLASIRERDLGLQISLVSMDDVFIRGASAKNQGGSKK